MGVQVLVVEDEADIARVYAEWLRDDYETTVAHDAATAIEKLSSDPDVVLLDRRLPDQPGRAVLEAVRDRSIACQVAMVTAVEPDFDVVEMGFDAYLVKPVERERLLETVERLVRRTSYDAQVREHVALVSKKAVLEVNKPAAELATSDEYARLERAVADSRERLEELLGGLEGRDLDTVMRNLTAGSGPEGPRTDLPGDDPASNPGEALADDRSHGDHPDRE